MNRILKASTGIFVALVMSLSLSAQSLNLDDFGNGTTTGEVISGTSWVGQLTQNATTLTVGGSALSDSGWGAVNLALPDLSTFSFVALTLELLGDNTAANIFVTFDDGGDFQTVTFNTSSFSVGAMTTVYVPIAWTINTATVEAWNIGGGIPPPGTGSPAFRMIFDNLALTSAVPEPSTYAMIAGVLVLGLAAWRRRVA
jgi:hypothetical protein